jgi:hypothetical protein
LKFLNLGAVIKNLLLASLSILFLSACSDVQFAKTSASDGGNIGTGGPKDGTPVNTCTPILPSYSGDLRISFMVDHSGSTKTTDPNKYYRVDTLNKFLMTYGSKSNLTYSYGYFSDVARLYNTNGFGSSTNLPFFNSAMLQNAVNAYKALSIADTTTNYKAGIGIMKSQILYEMSLPNSSKAYSVVFMSDGMPKDLGSSPTVAAAALVKDLVQAVTNGGGGLRLSTVYFGPTASTDAKDVLKTMASAGKGQFIDTNVNNNTFDVADAIAIPGVPCGE